MVRSAPTAHAQSPVHATSPSRSPHTSPSASATSQSPPRSSSYDDPGAVCRSGDDPRPIWIPLGEGADCVSPEVRHAAVSLIQPFFDEHVANSDSSIERMLAASLVYLMWNEVLEHHERKREQALPESGPGPAEPRGAIIDRQLKVIDRKLRIAQFLLKLRQKQAAGEGSGRPSPLAQCGLTREKLREAMANAARTMPAQPPPQPQLPPTAARPPAKPQAEPRPAERGNILDERENPTSGPRNFATDPHEVRTLTQIAPPAHTTGEKGTRREGRKTTSWCLIE